MLNHLPKVTQLITKLEFTPHLSGSIAHTFTIPFGQLL